MRRTLASTIRAISCSQIRWAAASSRPLAGRTAIVTGSTSGIGLGIAEALATQGANVVLNGLGDKAEIERVRQNVRSRPRSLESNRILSFFTIYI